MLAAMAIGSKHRRCLASILAALRLFSQLLWPSRIVAEDTVRVPRSMNNSVLQMKIIQMMLRFKLEQSVSLRYLASNHGQHIAAPVAAR